MKNKKKPNDTLTRILDSAEPLFARQGFDGTSTRQIAAGAGISIQTMHYHGKSKANLYLMVIRRAAAPSLEMVTQHIQHLMESSVWDEKVLKPAINAVIDDLFDILHANPNYARLYFRQYMEHKPELIDKEFENLAKHWTENIKALLGVKNGNGVDLPLVMLNLAWMYHGMFVNSEYISGFLGMDVDSPDYLNRLKTHAKNMTWQMIGGERPLGKTA